MSTRIEQFTTLFADQPSFRVHQIERALFDPRLNSWSAVTVLSAELRKTLEQSVPWMSLKADQVLSSDNGDAVKALVILEDDNRIETVLMKNTHDNWTICLSAQVGCAMRCSFCATGRLGFKRNLNVDEIVDQVRFWQSYLVEQKMSGRISNLVLMGQGEPLANYENIKAALNLILEYTDLGPTKITVSTVGLLPVLDQILEDKTWPHVRLAISLHAADETKRRSLVPSTAPDFHAKLIDWCARYQNTLGNRQHHLTFEYILLDGVNDSQEDAKALSRLVNKCRASIKVNLIPFNCVPGLAISAARRERIDQFKKILRAADLDVTERASLGSDIAAACGQLASSDQSS